MSYEGLYESSTSFYFVTDKTWRATFSELILNYLIIQTYNSYNWKSQWNFLKLLIILS
jgi:hypothetical protein